MTRQRKRERLQRTHVDTLTPGDEFVKPGYLQVYGEDRDGFASLSPNAGTRYLVQSVNSTVLRAVPMFREGLPVVHGETVTGTFNDASTVLKVV